MPRGLALSAPDVVVVGAGAIGAACEATPEARGALFLPRNGWVNNERLVTALVRAGARRGVRFALGEPFVPDRLIR